MISVFRLNFEEIKKKKRNLHKCVNTFTCMEAFVLKLDRTLKRYGTAESGVRLSFSNLCNDGYSRSVEN